MNIKILSRTNKPNNIDTADQHSLCSDQHNNWYIQLSSNAEQPRWELIGKLDTCEILIKLIEILR